nr:uncharacterized mitochondrial protein AtMg00810-like [Tanacetum cinerariifolium]
GHPQHALKDKGVIDSGCSRYMTGNISYLSDFQEINGGYVAFNPKGGKITSKGKIKTDIECIILSPEFKLPDENQELLRVPRENNMYNVDLKNIAPSGDLTCLFEKATFDEFNLLHRRLSYVNFKTMNKLVKGEENVQQYVLFPLWSSGYKNPQNTDDDAAFGGKKHEFDRKKPESKVYVSPSSRYRNLSVEFEDFSNNNINKVNAADSLVFAVGKISTNRTNTFSAAGPSNTAVSPIHGKSSYVDTSQNPDDPNMPALEDITYSDDEEDIGKEADFTNLETKIIVSHIPTTRVHKDHPVTQSIGDLSSATQTRSMTRVEEGIDYEEDFAPVARIESIRLILAYASFMGFMVYQINVKSAFLYGTIEEEVYVCQPTGFEDPDYPNKVYKVVKILYGLHQAPRACTPIDTEKPLLKDPDGEDVDVHTYRSMICSLMYLTPSRPDIIYLKGKPHLGLWYPKDSPFNLVAYSDSDYVGARLDRMSTTEGCQFLRCRLISWKCNKQIVVGTSCTEAEYVAAPSCCAQVLWIQNQLLDYGLTMKVAQSSMKSLKRNLHVTNILSAGYITTPQMVLDSPCLTHINN